MLSIIALFPYFLFLFTKNVPSCVCENFTVQFMPLSIISPILSLYFDSTFTPCFRVLVLGTLSLPPGMTSGRQKGIEDMENVFRRAVVMGCACVITSRMTVEQIEKYVVYHPEALCLVDEDDKTVFEVALEDGPGHIEAHKAGYSRTKTPDGRATITVVIDPEAEDKSALVLKHFGKALMHLEELEDQLLKRAGELEEEVSSIKALISQG